MKGPCVLASGVMDLLAYAPKADVIITTDQLIIDNGATLNFTTNGRRIDVFANKVAIKGECLQATAIVAILLMSLHPR